MKKRVNGDGARRRMARLESWLAGQPGRDEYAWLDKLTLEELDALGKQCMDVLLANGDLVRCDCGCYAVALGARGQERELLEEIVDYENRHLVNEAWAKIPYPPGDGVAIVDACVHGIPVVVSRER